MGISLGVNIKSIYSGVENEGVRITELGEVSSNYV